MLWTQELSYSNKTSSMLRHLRARHDDNHSQQNSDPVNTGNPDSKLNIYVYPLHICMCVYLLLMLCIIFIEQPFSHTVSRKQKLDEALVDMIVKDGQPFSIVEDEGFQNFIKILDPSYSIPSHKKCKGNGGSKVHYNQREGRGRN